MAVLTSDAADNHDPRERGLHDPSDAPWQRDLAEGDLEAIYRGEGDGDLVDEEWESAEDELS